MIRGRAARFRQRVSDTSNLPTQLTGRVQSLVRGDWYRHHNHDVAIRGCDPVEHFLSVGLAENRNPNPLFNALWYLENHDVPEGTPALLHYLENARSSGNRPHVVFNIEFYEQWMDADDERSHLEHYLTDGWHQGHDPHPLFSSGWFVEQSTRSFSAAWTPFEDFVARPHLETGDPGPFFLAGAYYRARPDVRLAGVNALVHYETNGRAEITRFQPFVDHEWYLERLEERHRAGENVDPERIEQFGTIDHFYRGDVASGSPASSDPMAVALAQSLHRFDQRARSSIALTEEAAPEFTIDWTARARRISLPASDHPRVSVIIPTLNHLEDVVRCLESIELAGDATAIEVILVDDASTAQIAKAFDSVDGLRVTHLPTNVGFAGACAAGVEAASGEHIMLLNNDTRVIPGWIDSLVDELDQHPGTGAVGSMIIRDDLLLQESGVIVWSDGSGWQYGNGESPYEPQYRFRRVVDYCSGAALLVRRSVWDRLGGFDARFAPAYYEDTDLCFEIRELGLDVVIRPDSMVIHAEGSSSRAPASASPTPTAAANATGMKRFQALNHPKFVEKWSSRLEEQHDHPDTNQLAHTLLIARDRRETDDVFVIDHRDLTPDEDSGSLRMTCIIEDFVARGFTVRFKGAKDCQRYEWRVRMTNLGVEVIPHDSDLSDWLRAYRDSTHFIWVARPPVLGDAISDIALHAPQIPLVYDMVDAHGRRMDRQYAQTGDPADREKAIADRRLERIAARSADLVVTLSDDDEEYIRGVADTSITCVRVPNVHDVLKGSQVPGFEFRSGLLFVGGFDHAPNSDAVEYMVNEIMPLLVEAIPDIHLTVVGRNPGDRISTLASPSVTVAGWVADIAPVYAATRVVVAPLRYGAGVKGKIGQALAMGVPTVTTSIGNDGMRLAPGIDIEVADDPQTFADKIGRLYNDPVAWQQRSIQGMNRIGQLYGRSATTRNLTTLLRELGL
jgi:GT2 family glycosyltransferase/glycosyltransferase involved in cell wall biosynthesis